MSMNVPCKTCGMGAEELGLIRGLCYLCREKYAVGKIVQARFWMRTRALELRELRRKNPDEPNYQKIGAGVLASLRHGWAEAETARAAKIAAEAVAYMGLDEDEPL